MRFFGVLGFSVTARLKYCILLQLSELVQHFAVHFPTRREWISQFPLIKKSLWEFSFLSAKNEKKLLSYCILGAFVV